MSETIPSASDNGGAWGFSRKDAARIAGVVKRVEAQYRNKAPERWKYPVAPGASPSVLIPAQLTGALATGTISAPTNAGAVTLTVVGSGPALSPSGGKTITVYNTYAATVASGKTVWCVVFNGTYYVVQADC